MARDEQKRNPSSIMIREKGNDVNHGSYPDFQQDARVTAGTTKTNKERGVIGEVAEVNHNLILKRSDDSLYLKGNDKNVNGADGLLGPNQNGPILSAWKVGLYQVKEMISSSSWVKGRPCNTLMRATMKTWM